MLRIGLVAFTVAVVVGCAQAQDDQKARMQALSRALGVECAQCHAADDWKRDDKQQFAFTTRMMKMTEGLSAGTLRDMGGLTCWTCHRGKLKPERMPRAGWQDRLAKWPEALK